MHLQYTPAVDFEYNAPSDSIPGIVPIYTPMHMFYVLLEYYSKYLSIMRKYCAYV